MKLDLAAWPDGTTAKDFDETGEDLNLVSDMTRFPDPAHIHLLVHKANTEVVIEGSLEMSVRSTCVRCLEEFNTNLSENFRRVALVVPDSQSKDDSGDPDYVFLPQSFPEWDLNESFREIVILSLPENPLCREDCRGICPLCGANRNTDPCRCHESHQATTLADLSDLLAQSVGKSAKRGRNR